MIEKMLINVKKHLPLTINEIVWDGDVLNIVGNNWNFTTLSAWRVITKKKMIFGCFDRDITEELKCFEGLQVIQVISQSNLLQIDPVFVFSNGQMLEIFSSDTFEPWTFKIAEEAMYIASPSEPNAFENNEK